MLAAKSAMPSNCLFAEAAPQDLTAPPAVPAAATAAALPTAATTAAAAARNAKPVRGGRSEGGRDCGID